MSGGLGAETAILGAASCFHIHDRAKVDFVSFIMLADAIGPGHQVENIGSGFQRKELHGFLTVNLSACQHPLS